MLLTKVTKNCFGGGLEEVEELPGLCQNWESLVSGFENEGCKDLLVGV